MHALDLSTRGPPPSRPGVRTAGVGFSSSPKGGNIDDLLSDLNTVMPPSNSRTAPLNKAGGYSGGITSGSGIGRGLGAVESWASPGGSGGFNKGGGLGGSSTSPGMAKGTKPTGGNLKCSPLLIADTSVPLGGPASIFSEKACDRLRCTACDFEVICFANEAWAGDVDYMFFRNNMPNEQKLRQRMVRKMGARAYACQCSWRTIVGQEKIDVTGSLRWVCGGH